MVVFYIDNLPPLCDFRFSTVLSLNCRGPTTIFCVVSVMIKNSMIIWLHVYQKLRAPVLFEEYRSNYFKKRWSHMIMDKSSLWMHSRIRFINVSSTLADTWTRVHHSSLLYSTYKEEYFQRNMWLHYVQKFETHLLVQKKPSCFMKKISSYDHRMIIITDAKHNIVVNCLQFEKHGFVLWKGIPRYF